MISKTMILTLPFLAKMKYDDFLKVVDKYFKNENDEQEIIGFNSFMSIVTETKIDLTKIVNRLNKDNCNNEIQNVYQIKAYWIFLKSYFNKKQAHKIKRNR